jgi:hypothetical protein
MVQAHQSETARSTGSIAEPATTPLPHKMEAGQTRLMVLAPQHAKVPSVFENVKYDERRHREFLSGMQRLRGSLYLQDGAIERRDLSEDGRHCIDIDRDSWHLLALDRSGRVCGCVRYRAHHNTAGFHDLWVRQSALATSPIWGTQFRHAVESEMLQARRRNISYVELGGWAIALERRCTAEALRIALSTYCLAQVLGGCIGITTATLRHCSSSILRRIGGRSLESVAGPLPPYYDPQFECDMEVLRFDSAFPAPKYARLVEQLRAYILAVPVICQGMRHRLWAGAFGLRDTAVLPLGQLQHA